MDERYTMALLAILATTLAAAVILAEVTGAYRQAAFSGGLVGAFCLGGVIGLRSARPVAAVALVGVVAVGFVGAVYWDGLDRYRLPPTSPETYLIVPLVVLTVGLIGYGIGRLLRQRTSVLAVLGTGTD